MFDVNLNDVELEMLDNIIDKVELTIPDARADIVRVVNKLLEMRFNRGKQQGKAVLTDAIVDSIVYELKR